MVAEAIRLPSVLADDVPDFSLAAARRAWDGLEGWAMSEAACALPEHEVELQMETRGREAMRLMLQAHMNRRGTGRVGPALRVVSPEGDARHEEARVDPKKIVSIFGDVTARRTAYAAEGAESVHPLDETASLPARSFSYELQRRVVDEAVRGPFDEAVESIEKTTGNTLSKRSAEEVVESLFRDTPEEDTPRERAPRARPEHKRVWASIEKTKDDVIGEVVAEMTARDPEGAKLRVVVTDGERALQARVKKAVPGTTLVLDLLHALEYLWKAAYAFHAEGSDEAAEWVRRRTLMILRGEVSQVVKGMRGSATKRRLAAAKRKAVVSAARYFMRNRQRMRYDEYLAKGLPIASGAVEGACKNLVKDRMERSGMRWRVPGAEAVLRLRAVRLSGDMDKYWPFHIAREQERLYGGRTWRALE